ncbi:uracil-DNA glycosylase [Alteribacter natronophilus]|uniref:uracil-DNA glycosylase n=1 Tax=Alteribacter natronophilus TaxID=2583810 RepID=UPI00110F4D45|nr:uracil-DNA glycosylase [Alteribacter natronophilus]TMW70117.1 uracil-DNA glycosylase [Alteribacter natronophilus]
MQIPDSLAELGRKRMGDRPVEGFVYGGGPDRPALMLVGEAPGETEIHEGRPFTGRAGKELMKFLDRLGLTRGDVYITSAVRSRPYRWGEKKNRDGNIVRRKYNRPPVASEILAHAPVLDYEIKHVQAPVIVTLGNVGLKRLAGPDKKITSCHGELLEQPVLKLEDEKFVWTDRTYRLFPTFHPASIFYNRSLLEKIHSDLDKLAESLTENKKRPEEK